MARPSTQPHQNWAKRGADRKEGSLPGLVEEGGISCVDGGTTAEEADVASGLVHTGAVLSDGQQQEEQDQGSEDNH
eukprot:CAMPEP_0206576680 /NCGR_PEP_ID=MMETSP0325_2-20121206/30885_1 /ASSEMBLY_ACC=CAM_ASM_000347 /TAXON_ID=2866 /ORGANISM="Crypthecodinium cohnii, Strain Seligo" /LENGTH=75 /DNA_ID=CAMNT_0054081921 /DNA_START=493 /DNA_END=721 /DNA_ORIENTATION=-